MKSAILVMLVGAAIAAPGARALGAEPDAPACTVSVGPDQSIQAAIDAAPEGAVICLKGLWQESLTITKDLTLRAAAPDGASINGGLEGGRPVILVVSEKEIEVRLVGLTVAVAGGLNDTHYYEDGVRVEGRAKIVIEDCTILGNTCDGVHLEDQAQAVIESSRIFSNEESGISAMDSTQVTVIDSRLAGNRGAGVVLGGAARGEIRGCSLQWNWMGGIVVAESATAAIEACRLQGNGKWGVILGDTAQATLIGNTIVGHELYGVALTDPPCFEDGATFLGYVAGHGNVIPGPADPDGNGVGAVCPEELSFLATETGGTLDRRK